MLLIILLLLLLYEKFTHMDMYTISIAKVYHSVGYMQYNNDIAIVRTSVLSTVGAAMLIDSNAKGSIATSIFIILVL